MDCGQDDCDSKCGENTMIEFSRYPHVGTLISHYANQLNEIKTLELIKAGISSKDDAEHFSRFIWRMLDQMAIDIEQKKEVIGNIDNSSMIPDIDYEVSLYLADRGFGAIWDDICDEN
jgi:hypothetical protein